MQVEDVDKGQSLAKTTDDKQAPGFWRMFKSRGAHFLGHPKMGCPGAQGDAGGPGGWERWSLSRKNPACPPLVSQLAGFPEQSPGLHPHK